MGVRASWGMLTTEHRRWCQPAGPTPGSGPVCGSAWLGVASEPGHLLRLGVPRESALLSPAESVSPGSREHLQRKAPYPAAPSLLPCPPLGSPRGMRVPGLLFLLDPRRNSGSRPTTQCSAEACSCASEVALAHLTSPATLAPRLSGLLALSSTPPRPAPRRGGGASRTARLRQQRQGGAPGLGLVPVQNCEDTGTRAQNLHGGDTAGFRGGGYGGRGGSSAFLREAGPGRSRLSAGTRSNSHCLHDAGQDTLPPRKQPQRSPGIKGAGSGRRRVKTIRIGPEDGVREGL